MESDPASHDLWLQPSRQCGISALNAPDPAPTPGASVPFGSTQPSYSCARDTDHCDWQLVELPLINIIGLRGCAKKSGRQFIRSRCTAHSRPNTCTRAPHDPLPRDAEVTRTSRRPPESWTWHAWAGLGLRGSARNQAALPRRGVSCFARSDSTAGSNQTRMACTTQFERSI